MTKETQTMRGLTKSLLETLESEWNDHKDESEDTQREWISEQVDGYIPVYTYDLLEIAQSDLWLATSVPELLAFDGQATPANAIAGNIYQELQEKGQEWLDAKRKDI